MGVDLRSGTEMTAALLTQAAHELWRMDMLRRGWVAGPAYDPDERIHDALVPFDELGERDQALAMACVKASGAARLLIDAIDYQRAGPTAIADLTVGDRVRLYGVSKAEGINVSLTDIGEVIDVSQHDDPVVTVRWPSGDETTHTDLDQDLVRLRI